MLLSLFLVAFGLSACTSPHRSAMPSPSDSAMTLFDFSDADAPRWRIMNDGVMGGLSKGYVSVEDGKLRFTGTLVTRGGGFTSTRAPKRLDLSAYDGIELRVRGGGRTFEVEVSDGTMVAGGGVWRAPPLRRRASGRGSRSRSLR